MNNFSYKNFGKKTDPNWKFIADVMLYTLPFLLPIITTMPVSDTFQKWLIVGVNIVVIVFKAISKFTVDKEYYGEVPNKE
ncbi:MAG TPA: hypothetical protein PLG47_03370 [Candidatus Dojkabacteria bacterium]|nr:hypothetical protein [Candidatus Dojkabacteria bacterium]